VRRGTEVFVIGGGPAGLAAAIAACKKGFRVVVADGAKPPVAKACGEGLMPDTLAALGELGVALQPSDGFTVRGIRFLDGATAVDASFPRGSGLGVKRTVLHKKMLEKAEACGVSFLWNTPVTALATGGVVAGGAVMSARWIIGADGMRSRVRRWSGLEGHTRFDCRFARQRHYRVEPWSDCTELYWSETAQAYVTPVSSREVCVVLVSRAPSVRLEVVWREFPGLAHSLKYQEPSSVERGAVTAMHTLKQVCRGNVALLGDASGSIDAITGEGLCLSFHQAVALADALEAGDLSGYQIAHRRLARRPRMMGRLMLGLDGRPALRRRAIRALASHPGLFARLVAMHVGETSSAHFAKTGALLGWHLLAA
jgi:menaquinone-9 beta-reductase